MIAAHPYATLTEPWWEPFRKLLVHPQIVGRLNEMSGKGFRLDHGPLLIGAEESRCVLSRAIEQAQASRSPHEVTQQRK